ncbi:MAG TPA: hypothetical protein VGN64_24295 [Dyadobacter sp.]|jgi:hypothetical protein|nr:hypothetical protein [Dyadobacter sp.]
MTFDNNGNVFPYKQNSLTSEEFELSFGTNEHRLFLLAQLQDFFTELKSVVEGPIKFWIDGSFVTKKSVPKDIDVVVFINFHSFKLQKRQLSALKEKQEFVDLYYVKVFPEDHIDHHLTQFDQLDWLHFFTTDRRNKKKGFIELTF